MKTALLLLGVLAAIGYFYIQRPPPDLLTTNKTIQKTTPNEEIVSHPPSPAATEIPLKEEFDSKWFGQEINEISEACLLALSSGGEEMQGQIASLRDAAVKSRYLSAQTDLQVGTLRLLSRLHSAFNELRERRKKFKDIDNQQPATFDRHQMSVDEWREQKKKRTEANWTLRQRAIKVEIDNITNNLVMRSKVMKIDFHADDAFVSGTQNFKAAHRRREAARELDRRAKIQQIEVTQVITKGVLADPLKSVNRSSYMTTIGGGGPGVYSYHLSGRTVYIEGLSGMAEGQRALVRFVDEGVFHFTDVMGASRTVPKWKFIRIEEEPK